MISLETTFSRPAVMALFLELESRPKLLENRKALAAFLEGSLTSTSPTRQAQSQEEAMLTEVSGDEMELEEQGLEFKASLSNSQLQMIRDVLREIHPDLPYCLP